MSTPAPVEPQGAAGPISWLATGTDAAGIRELLRDVIDPELGVNIVDLGLVYEIALTSGVARIRMTLTTPGCPLGGYLQDEIDIALSGVPGVESVDLQLVWEPAWDPQMMTEAAKAELGWRG